MERRDDFALSGSRNVKSFEGDAIVVATKAKRVAKEIIVLRDILQW